jgi:hypothetical protein
MIFHPCIQWTDLSRKCACFCAYVFSCACLAGSRSQLMLWGHASRTGQEEHARLSEQASGDGGLRTYIHLCGVVVFAGR